MNNKINFTWIDNKIAGSSMLNDIQDLKFIKNQGIHHIISLTVNIPLVKKYNQDRDLFFYHIPVQTVPTNNQLIKFIDLVKNKIQNGEKAVIHCQFGRERTGIFLVFYLCYFNNLSIDNAITQVRNKIPKSLLNSSTITFLQTNLRDFLEKIREVN